MLQSGTRHLHLLRGDLDLETPEAFDNHYYANLRSGEGLLKTDQLLYSNGTETTKDWVEFYIQHQPTFFSNFKKSMIKMGNIKLLTGTSGEIRRNCRSINLHSSA
jgi:peroxidase